MSFKAAISLSIFLCGRSIHWSQWGIRISYSNCISASLPLCSWSFALYIFVLPCLVHKCLLRLYSVVALFPYHYVLSLFLYYSLLKSILSDTSIHTPAFFSFPFAQNTFFPVPLLLVFVYLLIWDVSLGGSIYIGLVFLFIQLALVFWLGHLSQLHLR